MLDSYDVVRAARELERFVIEDLSNWYIRRSRRRFQRPEQKKEKDEATAVLYYLLYNVALYTAPFTPFLAEYAFQELTQDKKRSVHWELLPALRKLTAGEKKIISEMERLRSVVAEGLRLRGEAGIRERQPLQAIFLEPKLFVRKELWPLILDELNVKEVIESAGTKKSSGLVCGKVGEARASSAPSELPKVPGEFEGRAAKVCLDTRLNDTLLRDGLFKELVRNVQDLRKTAGLSPKHKVYLFYFLPDPLRGHLGSFEKLIAEETNARQVVEQRDSKKVMLGEARFPWRDGEGWGGIKKAKV